jgi:hypothetical protein
MRLVLPVRKVSAVPSFPHTRRFAAACASCWRPLRGAPLEASAQVRASRGQTSACVVGRGAIASVGRPLLLGRLARVTQIRRVPSSAHRGRRIASADSCATRVACGGFAFASRIRIAHSALALAPVVPASPVNRSAPTHRSRGRCAMKPRSAPELKRWAPPQAPASPGSHGTAFAFGRPLSLGRATGVALVRRVSSSARRGRRIASADFHSTGVACGVGGFVSRGHCAATAPALSRIFGALCVQPSRPNPPVNLAPFGRWTLRDEAAQRR